MSVLLCPYAFSPLYEFQCDDHSTFRFQVLVRYTEVLGNRETMQSNFSWYFLFLFKCCDLLKLYVSFQ